MSDEFIEEVVGFWVEEVMKIRNGELGIDVSLTDSDEISLSLN